MILKLPHCDRFIAHANTTSKKIRLSSILGMKTLSILFIALLFSHSTQAQVAKTQVVQLESIANDDGTITLKWPTENYTGNYVIYKRDVDQTIGTWSSVIATVAGTNNSWTDATMKVGMEREYCVAKVKSTATEALGYILAGNKTLAKPNIGGIILLIDSSYQIALKSEINVLKADLTAAGWKVYLHYAGRSETAENVKKRIAALLDKMPTRARSLYIIGHVPVPYSGYFSSTGDRPPPDGHVEGSGNHTGAWPADVYYGDLNGIYTDRMVDCTTGSDTRNHNKPNDGKFDQSVTVENIELEIGRVDFYNMPAFSTNDTQMVRDYLNRVHQWRLGQTPYVNRALIDNNFTGLNLASSGYQNLPTFVGIDSVFDNRDYFQSQNSENYLWSYGCGAGSYTSCSGIGTSNDFAANQSKFSNIFTMLAGSFFGDWDSKNNLLRSSIAAGSLNCMWAGIPKWYLHHMGLGSHIGLGAKITQNNENQYFNGSFNGSWRGVFIALMGDPSIQMIPVKPVSNLSATSKNGIVTLKWSATDDVDGYYIYLHDTATGEFTLASAIRCPGSISFTKDTVYTDNCNWTSGNFRYAVRAMKISKTGSGSFENLSLAEFVHIDNINAVDNSVSRTNNVQLSPNPIVDNTIQINGLSPNIHTEVRLYNVQGKLMSNWLFNPTQFTEKLKISENLTSGIYQIQIIQNQHQFTESVILN